MALQISSALQAAGHRLLSRTGGILLGAYLVLMLSFQVLFNSLLATVYTQMGYGTLAELLPLVVDMPLAVSGAGLAVGLGLSLYLSIVMFRTFVAGTGDRFPDGAFTRNIPLAMVNVFVGGLVYGLLVLIGLGFFVVPGIFAYVAFVFMVPYVVAEDDNFVGALKKSYRLTEGDRLSLFFLLVIVIGGASLLGGIVGLLGAVALPQPAAQLLMTLIQAPVALYTTAVIAVAFTQLRDVGETPPSTPSEADTPTSTA